MRVPKTSDFSAYEIFLVRLYFYLVKALKKIELECEY